MSVTAHNKALQSRQCTRCSPCGFAGAQLYHKANSAYTAAERDVQAVEKLLKRLNKPTKAR